MYIKIDDLRGTEIKQLLEQHLADMFATSPAESVHALDLPALRQTDITFWSGWIDDQLAGCIALKRLDKSHAEIKSMRTHQAFRKQGVASQLLEHVLTTARTQGYSRLSLETGTMAYFAAARNLYLKYGFLPCDPFADYQADPNSVFMTIVFKTISLAAAD